MPLLLPRRKDVTDGTTLLVVNSCGSNFSLSWDGKHKHSSNHLEGNTFLHCCTNSKGKRVREVYIHPSTRTISVHCSFKKTISRWNGRRQSKHPINH